MLPPLFPISWRPEKYQRLFLAKLAARWIEKIRLTDWVVLEIGPRPRLGSGRMYLSSPEAKIPSADIVLFLGLADHLGEAGLSRLLGRIPAKRVLFSYREDSGPRFFLRFTSRKKTNTYHSEQVKTILRQHGYRHCEVRSLPLFTPVKLVLAERPNRS